MSDEFVFESDEVTYLCPGCGREQGSPNVRLPPPVNFPELSKPRRGLWRKDTEAPEGKYCVTRRDGSVPEWPFFVLGARDPSAARTLMAYAKYAERDGADSQYVEDVRVLAGEFDAYRQAHGVGDPDSPPHRLDDPATIEKMKQGKGA